MKIIPNLLISNGGLKSLSLLNTGRPYLFEPANYNLPRRTTHESKDKVGRQKDERQAIQDA
jgi:hypothetical protein